MTKIKSKDNIKTFKTQSLDGWKVLLMIKEKCAFYNYFKKHFDLKIELKIKSNNKLILIYLVY
jgi:hypothetical protein